MTKDEYLIKEHAIKYKANKERSALAYEYAMANNPYAIGDVIKDHAVTARIEKIEVKFPFGSKIPECVYHGPLLKKDGKPYKNGQKACIYQSNIKSSQNVWAKEN